MTAKRGDTGFEETLDVASADVALDATAAPGSVDPGTTMPSGHAAAPGGQRIGRFVVVDQLGEGGMGTVFGAYDPSLDRKVAIKLVRVRAAGEVARERLLREARAMARLSHPNVLVVHEVGTWEGQVFIAMELAAGGTLRAWCARQPRPWRELVARFVAAARGLAAAHDAGMIHRDFKPDNVLLTREGEVRVGDFGLVGTHDDDPVVTAQLPQPPDLGGEVAIGRSVSSTPRAAGSFGAELTHAGSILGTPAYMAPEQFLGERAGPAADQFALCVAAWEALYGVRPFAGNSFAELQRAVLDAKPPVPPRDRNVPAWIETVLLRGLAREPADRWPSMHALIAALSVDPEVARRRRLQLAGASVALTGVAVVGFFALRGDDGADARAKCQRAGEGVAAVWSAQERVAIESAFGSSGRAHAARSATIVTDALDAFAAGWSSGRVDTCEATHVRGEQSNTLFDLRMRCLDRQLATVATTIAALGTNKDGQLVDAASDIAAKLPAPDACADIEALSNLATRPGDARSTATIAQIEALSEQALAHDLVGRHVDELAVAEQMVALALTVEHAPSRAFAYTWHGGALLSNDRPVDAEASYLKAIELSAAGGDSIREALSWRDLLFARVRQQRLGGIEPLLVATRSAAARTRRPDDLVQADTAIAVAYFHVGRDADAHAILLRSLAHHAQQASDKEIAWHLEELASVEINLGKLDDALAHAREAVAVTRKIHGDDHPMVAKRLVDVGAVQRARGEYLEALATLEEAHAIQLRVFGAASPRAAEMLSEIGDVHRDLGDYERADRAYRESLAVFRSAPEVQPITIARTLERQASLATERWQYREALTLLGEAWRVAETGLPMTRGLQASIANERGNVMGYLGDLRGGLPYIEQAIAIWTEIYGPDTSWVANGRENLASQYQYLREYERSLSEFQATLAIRERTIGPDTFNTLATVNNMATTYFHMNDYTHSVPLHERALAGFEKSVGKGGFVTAVPLGYLAYSYVELGRIAEGRAAAERALEIVKTAGSTEAQQGDALFALGHALWAEGKDRRRAAELVRQALVYLREPGNDPGQVSRAEAWLKARGLSER